jgi:hypothetical protein
MHFAAMPGALALAGTISIIVAVLNERRMHRHRQPGVSYGQATFRRDGGWRRSDLFTAQGLAYQRKAATYGVGGTLLWILALITYIIV